MKIHYKYLLKNSFERYISVPSVSNYNFDKSKQCIGAMTIEIDFLQKKSTDSSPYDSDKMAAEFIQQFNNQSFSVTQQVYIHMPLNDLFSLSMHMHFVLLFAFFCFNHPFTSLRLAVSVQFLRQAVWFGGEGYRSNGCQHPQRRARLWKETAEGI